MNTTSMPDKKANISFILPNLATGGDLDIDNEVAFVQLIDLINQYVSHIVDCRLEANDEEFVTDADPDMQYLHTGVDDDGGKMPHSWYEDGTRWIVDAIEQDKNAVVFVHCHMGINRGPSLAFAAMLLLGHDPVEAIEMIRKARPIAAVDYAEDALNWFHISRDITAEQREANDEALAKWRKKNPHETRRIIREIRRGEDPMNK